MQNDNEKVFCVYVLIIPVVCYTVMGEFDCGTKNLVHLNGVSLCILVCYIKVPSHTNY